MSTVKVLKYEIVKNFGTISKTAKGWSKELNLISWNEREPKFDIREWSPTRDKMYKGITLSKEDMMALKEILNTINFEE